MLHVIKGSISWRRVDDLYDKKLSQIGPSAFKKIELAFISKRRLPAINGRSLGAENRVEAAFQEGWDLSKLAAEYSQMDRSWSAVG